MHLNLNEKPQKIRETFPIKNESEEKEKCYNK